MLMKKIFTLIAAALLAVSASADEVTLWSSDAPTAVDWGTPIQIVADKFASVKAGDVFTIHITDVSTAGGEWGAQVVIKDGKGTDLEAGVPIGDGDKDKAEFVVTGDILALLHANGLQINGTGYSATKVTLEAGVYEGSEQSIWLGNATEAVTVNSNHFVNANNGAGPKADDIIRVKATAIADYTDDSWMLLSYSGNDTGWQWENYDGMEAIPTETGFDFVVTEANIAQIKLDGIIVNYKGYTITAVEYIANSDNDDTGEDIEPGTEVVLWEGTSGLVDLWSDGGNIPQPYILLDGGEQLKNAGAAAGDVVRFYITAGRADWQLQILEGHWTQGIPMYGYYAATALTDEKTGDPLGNEVVDLSVTPYVSLTLTEDILNAAYIKGGWGGVFVLNGDGEIVCTKVTLVKGGTDGINVVKTQVENGVIYNLAGQKVDQNYKGIVIMNGKKYMQK